MNSGRASFQRLGLFVLLALLGACASLPTEHEKAPSTALAPVVDTDDLKAVSTEVGRHGEESGFRLLTQGAHALLSRVVLADRATHSIDLQYYIYRNDPTGKLLSQRLLAAADRGVRVRMLLDDLGLDDQLKMLY